MASLLTWTEFLVTIILAVIISYTPSCESFSVAKPFSIGGLQEEPVILSREVRSTHSSKPKKKKSVLQVSKRLFKKIKKHQDKMEKDAEKESKDEVNISEDNDTPVYKAQLYRNSPQKKNHHKVEKEEMQVPDNDDHVPIYKSQLYHNSPQKKQNKIEKNEPEVAEDDAPVYKAQLYQTESKRPIPAVNVTNEVEFETRPYILPTYDCPPYNSGLDRDGNAIIKQDPNDCSCYYYCNWGIHYVQCCSWPLLWNDHITGCDWWWNVKCREN